MQLMIRKYLLLMTFFLAWQLPIAGQDTRASLDTLRIITNKNEFTTPDAELFNKHIRKLYQTAADSVLFYIKKTRNNPISASSAELARIYLIEGIIHKNLGNYETALETYNEAEAIYENLNDNSGLGKVSTNRGVVYKRKGDYTKALEYYIKAKEYKAAENNPRSMLAVNNNIATLYSRLYIFDKADHYLKENIRLAKELKLNNRLPAYYHNLGNNFLRRYEDTKEESNVNYLLDSTINNYHLALSHLPANKYPAAEATILHGMALVFQMQGDLEKSESYFRRALNLARKSGATKGILKSLQGLGQFLCDHNRKEEGLAYLEEAYELAAQQNELANISKLSGNLATEFDKIQDFKNSAKYYKVYIETKDSLREMEKRGQLQALSEEFHNRELQNQVKILRTQAKHQTAGVDLIRTKQQQSRRLQVLLMVASALFLLGLLYSSYSAIGMKRAYYSLLHRNFQVTLMQRTTAIQNKQITQKNQIKTRMFQIISHDLRSPLTSLDSFARLIPMWIEDNDIQSLKEVSHSVEDSVGRILGLVDNLLSWATNQEGEIPYNPESITLRSAAQESIELYKPMANSKKIALNNHIPLEYDAYADKQILATVFRNLVNNAIKYTPDGGEVHIGIKPSEEEAYLTLFVKDTGVGINKEKQDQLFALTRTRSRGTRGEEGNGLGLFFCKEFIELNKGTISIDSEEGEGTCVYFTIPSASKALNEAEEHEHSLT
ncbi:MAG: ATP-binding protein [Bacteroidota bacterium]